MDSNLNKRQKSINPVKPHIPPVLSTINLENNLLRVITIVETKETRQTYCLRELLQNLKLLRNCHRAGMSDEFLDRFYAFYQFNEGKIQ